MKLFLRGLFALSLTTALTLTAGAADKAAPAAAAPTASSCGCAADAGSAHRVLHGRFGKRHGGGLGGNGNDIGGRVAEAYIGANDRVAGFFQRLAGPPVDVAAAQAPGKKDRGPYTQPGTVVFPQHPFVRSPRDFFMTEQP